MNIDFVMVMGGWGSGTTAVTGVLERLGLHTCPPYFITNDDRTRCSYEPLYLRQILLTHIDELTVSFKTDSNALVEEMRRWINYTISTEKLSDVTMVMKHPLTAMAIPEIDRLLSPRYVLVNRPYEDIERSRLRRGWPAIFGEQGARFINQKIEDSMQLIGDRSIALEYPELIDTPERVVDELITFFGLDVDEETRNSALAYVRR